MIKRLPLLLALAGTWLQGRADVLPAERLLPKDTVLVVTATNWPAAWSFLTNSAYGRLWQDAAFFLARPLYVHMVTSKYDEVKKPERAAKTLTDERKVHTIG